MIAYREGMDLAAFLKIRLALKISTRTLRTELVKPMICPRARHNRNISALCVKCQQLVISKKILFRQKNHEVEACKAPPQKFL